MSVAFSAARILARVARVAQVAGVAVPRCAAVAVRWFAHEFLLQRSRRDQSEALIQACRLAGCATIGWVMRLGLSSSPTPRYPGSIALLVAVFLLAVLVGNVVKEIAVAGCGHLANWLGRGLRRTGMTLAGTVFREQRNADGTWRRYERQPAAIVCEWTDTQGECRKRVFRRIPADSECRPTAACRSDGRMPV